MELKDFIQTALTDLIEGVNGAKEKLNDNICPSTGCAFSDKANFVYDAHGLYVEAVEFDIAVTVEKAKEGNAKAGIKVWEMGAGVFGSFKSKNSTVSRIKFRVPIGLGKKAS